LVVLLVCVILTFAILQAFIDQASPEGDLVLVREAFQRLREFDEAEAKARLKGKAMMTS
jgi:hypothetical protein